MIIIVFFAKFEKTFAYDVDLISELITNIYPKINVRFNYKKEQ